MLRAAGMFGRMSKGGGVALPRAFLSDHPLPWLLPLITILLVFTLYPLAYSVYLSFHEFEPLSRSLEFVGFANWTQLFNDPRLWASLWVTLFYTAVCLIAELVLGMAIALLIDSDDPGFAIIRGLLTLTLVIPPAIAGMMFLLMEDSSFGIFTYLLRQIGIFGAQTTILSNSALAIWGVIAVDIWQWTPFMVLIFVAGLRALPTEPFESAVIDGAGALQILRRLTLPMMSKVIAIAVLIRGIDLFRMFDYVYVMTSGGPGTSTYMLSLYAWQQTFSFVKWGYGATISLLLLIIMLVAANLLVIFSRVRW